MRQITLTKKATVFFGALAALASVTLIITLAQEPADSESFTSTGDGTAGGLLEDPNLFQEFRAPLVTVSVITLVGAISALAFSGGVKYIDRKNVLESPVRKQMYDYIMENPGVYLREISRELALNPTNTTWHLRKLTEAELVRSQSSNGLKLYYPLEGGVRTRKTAVANAILRNDNARTIVAFLLAHPGSHQREMARALGVNHGTVRWHLKKLVVGDIVHEHKDGSAYRYYLSQEGMEILSDTGEMDEVLAPHEGTGLSPAAAAAMGEANQLPVSESPREP